MTKELNRAIDALQGEIWWLKTTAPSLSNNDESRRRAVRHAFSITAELYRVLDALSGLGGEDILIGSGEMRQ